MGFSRACGLFLGLFLSLEAFAGPITIGPGQPDRKPTKVSLVVQIPDDVKARLSPSQLQTLEFLQKQIAQELFFWGGFEIELPRPVIQEGAQIAQMSPFYTVDPVSHVERVAHDADGKRVRFSAEQWDQIRQDSIFKVEDPKNPGQFDVWKVTSALVHKGSNQITISLQEGLAHGIEHLLITFPENLVGDSNTSVLSGVRNILYGLRNSLGLLVGLTEETPKYNAAEVEDLVLQERANFVASKLPKGADLRLNYPDLMEKALPVLAKIWEQTESEWPDHEQSERKTISRFEPYLSLSLDERPQYMADALALSKQNLFFAHIFENKELDAISPGLDKLVVHHAQALSIIQMGRAKLAKEMADYRRSLEASYRADHPILSRVNGWYKPAIEQEVENHFQAIRGDRIASITQALEAIGMTTEASNLRAALQFVEEKEAGVRQDLAAEMKPARKFSFYHRIWFAKNWIKTQVPDGKGGHVWVGEQHAKLPDIYTDTPGWRLMNLAERSFSLLKDGLYWVAYRNFWEGPLGLRSLFSIDPYPVVFMVDPKSGEVVEDTSHERVGTLVSRFSALQRDVNDAMAKFEAAPDKGIIPKAFWRPVNIFWHGFVRRFFQPILNQGGQIVGTAANAVATGTLLAASPILALTGGLTELGFNATVWDFAAPRKSVKKGAIETPKDTGHLFPILGQFLDRSLYQGLGPAVITGVKAALLDAILAPTGYWSKATSQWVGETGRDALVRGIASLIGADRIPAIDPDRFVRRIQGPGVEGGYLLQVGPTPALGTMLVQMELLELEIYDRQTQLLLEQPLREAQAFLEPVSLLVQGSGQLALQPTSPMAKPSQDLLREKLGELRTAVQDRQQKLRAMLPQPKAQVKLSKADLDKVVPYGAEMAKKYFELRAFETMEESEIDLFWSGRKLTRDDWIGLSKQLLAATFGADVLVPAEATAETFVVRVDPADMRDGLNSLFGGGDLFKAAEGTWSSTAPTNVISQVPVIGASAFCARNLAAYGEGFGSVADLSK